MFKTFVLSLALLAIVCGESNAKPKPKLIDATVKATHNNDIRLSYYENTVLYHLDCTYSSGDKGYPNGAKVKLQVVNNTTGILTYKPEGVPPKTTKVVIVARRVAPEPKPKKD